MTVKILQNYMDCDQVSMLCGNGFKIPLKIGVINAFVPVMKTVSWIKPSRKHGHNEETVEINDEYNEYTTRIFVDIPE